MIVKKAVPGEWGIGSTADAMLQITKLPLLVVQPDAVRSLGRANLRSQHAPDEQVRCCHVCCMSCTLLLKSGYSNCYLHSTTTLSLTEYVLPVMQPVAPKQLTRMLSPPRSQQSVAQEDQKYKGRVVVIATEGTRAGQAIVHWAARNMLEKRDHVHVLRVHSKSGASNSSTAAPSSQGIGERSQQPTVLCTLLHKSLACALILGCEWSTAAAAFNWRTIVTVFTLFVVGSYRGSGERHP